jgi:hypothetical protein
MVRGAELYDLFMGLRYERAAANEDKVWSAMTNLARAYRDADVALRDGRKSWDLRDAFQRLPLAYGKAGDKR